MSKFSQKNETELYNDMKVHKTYFNFYIVIQNLIEESTILSIAKKWNKNNFFINIEAS